MIRSTLEGIVLRVNPYRDSKVMLSILFKDGGKKSLSGPKKLGLDMGDLGNFEVTSSKGNETVTGITGLKSPRNVRTNYAALILLGSICEICERATEGSDSEDLFEVLKLGKTALSEAKKLKDLLKAYVLTISGIGVHLGISNGLEVPSKKTLLGLLDKIEEFIGKKLYSRPNVESLLDDLEHNSEGRN